MNDLIKAVSKARLLSVLLLSTTFGLGQIPLAFAGEGAKDKQYTEEGIKREISFWAKKLLDMSGKDTLTITSSSVVKPFIGVCNMVDETGVKLTCITPESQADKNGLKTGDLVVAINGVSMVGNERDKKNHEYWGVVKAMKTGDLLKMDIIRSGEPTTIDVTVGSLSHPAFTCQINN